MRWIGSYNWILTFSLWVIAKSVPAHFFSKMILGKAGFRGNGRTSCVNIDECRLREHNCHANALCMDLSEGGFTCECNDGWKGNGVECFDIDECLRSIFK